MRGTGCAVRRGFFVLRDCGEPPVGICSQCQRSVCLAHSAGAATGLIGSALAGDSALRAAADSLVCLECQSRQIAMTDPTRRSSWRDTSGSDYYSYRHGYYSTYGYNPIYTGSRQDDYYDDYDIRSFDQDSQAAPAEQDSSDVDSEGPADFVDS
jgi:hypothetical protein